MTNSRQVAPNFAPITPRGTASYGLGFLAYLSAPFLSMVVAGAVMIALYPRQRRNGGVASENGRRAANWGITVLAVMFVLIVTFAATMLATGPGNRLAFVVAAIGYVALSAVHVAVATIGVVQTIGGRIFLNPLAIPFIRPTHAF